MLVKEFLAKYIGNLVTVLTFGVVCWLAVDYYFDKRAAEKERLLLEERYAALLDKVDEFDVIDEQLVSLRVQYERQEELLRRFVEAWPQDLRDKHERVKSLQDVTISLPGGQTKTDGFDYTFETEEGTKGFSLAELRVDGEDSPPIGYIMIDKEGWITKQSYPFDIKIEQTQFKDDLTGEVRVISRAYLVLQDDGLAGKRRPDLKRWKGVEYPLTTTEGTIALDPKEPIDSFRSQKEFIWFPMTLSAGVGAYGQGEEIVAGISLDTTLLGYGNNRRTLDYKFLQTGINFVDSSEVGISLIPASLRPLPNTLLNTYLGAGYYLNAKENSYFINLSVGL